jgi:hypothetical protein
VDGRQAKASRFNGLARGKTVRIGLDTRLKPGVNENQCQLPKIEMLTSG